MVLLWRVRGNGNGGRVFLLPRTGRTESKVRWIRFVSLLGCFFSFDVYTKSTEKDIAVKRIIISFCLLGVGCITEHTKFGIVCLDTDVLNTALVAIHNIRCNPLPDLIENRWVVAFVFFFFFGPKDRSSKHVLCTVWNIFYLSLCFFNFPRTWHLAAYRQFT